MDGEYDRPSVPGKNLTLSLDIDLQMLGERLLKNKIGSIVAIEPETGEILCLVSSPNYDPHLMIGRQRGKNHLALQRDMTKPLLNRALMGVYPPGSTFKTAQGLTFLQEGIITEQSPAFPCSHGFHYGRLTVGCHAHGSPLPLIPAIATSCNSYFCGDCSVCLAIVNTVRRKTPLRSGKITWFRKDLATNWELICRERNGG